MKLIVTITICFLLSACSFSGKKAPDKLYYRFPDVTSVPVKEVKLLVKRPSAMGILGNRPMVVQNSDGSLLQMQHNFWLESPKVLLKMYLEKVFASSVSGSESGTILDTHILHLEKKQEHAIVEIKFVITNDKRQQIFNKTYKAENKLEQNTIPSFVKSVSFLLENIVNQFINDKP